MNLSLQSEKLTARAVGVGEDVVVAVEPRRIGEREPVGRGRIGVGLDLVIRRPRRPLQAVDVARAGVA